VILGSSEITRTQETDMTRLLYRSGRWAAAHPWRALATWLLLLGALLGAAGAVGGTTQENWDVPGARAQTGIEMLREHVPGAGNAYARVVAHGDGPLASADVAALADRLGGLDHVVAVSPPTWSEDRDTAVLEVGYDVPVTHPDVYQDVAPLDEAAEPLRDAGVQVELSGSLPDTAAAPMKGHGELIGIAAALLILVLTFGSVVAAGLPVVVAVGGLVAGSGGLALLAAVMDVSPSAPVVATMVGLGVGIDYALLMAVRHTEFVRAGHDVVEAAGRASATAGRSVVFAAGTVLVSLLGLRLADLPTYSAFGFATAIAVVCVLVSALLLVPALCRLGGRRLMPRADRRRLVRDDKTPATARWAQRVSRRPLPWAVAASALMVLIALPTLDMRTWPHDSSAQSSELTTRRAFDIVSAEFGPGATTDMVVVADLDAISRAQLSAVVGDLGSQDGLVSVGEPQVSPDGAVAVIDLVPAYGATDERVPALVDSIRSTLPEGAELTGDLPFFDDISSMLADRLPVVVLFVVGVSVVLLMMMFRSVVVPVKAALMNLLSVSAAYGALTMVFQWGWGADLIGLEQSMPVSAWVPILVFAILFGLSMDYEVFLLSRIREHWLASGDARGSVVHGLSDTGRVISAAAAIMVAVFLGFSTEVDAVVKQIGLGMAVAVALDATVIRMVLVPSTMALLGRWNWWLPGWLDRLLPHLDAEVHLGAAPEDPRAPSGDRVLVDA
jgi:putative drug exporter of the RND superfamily